MSYAIIESTPGYLPEDDDPPVFDQYNEALNYLIDRYHELEDADEERVLEFKTDFKNGYFSYTDFRKMHDLGRIVEIVPVEEE